MSTVTSELSLLRGGQTPTAKLASLLAGSEVKSELHQINESNSPNESRDFDSPKKSSKKGRSPKDTVPRIAGAKLSNRLQGGVNTSQDIKSSKEKLVPSPRHPVIRNLKSQPPKPTGKQT